MNYQHILLATDGSPGSDLAGRRAVALARQHHAKLTILMVIESAAVVYASSYCEELVVTDDLNLQHRMEEYAYKELLKLAERLGMEEATPVVASGSVKGEIHRVARERGVDLIVVGSHGRHGLDLLLGSNANAVLHGAPCDVLAVRMTA